MSKADPHPPVPLAAGATPAWDFARLGLTLASLGPLFYWQGQQVRKKVPQLPECFEAEGRRQGRDPDLRLTFLGDSIMAGIGHDDPEQTLPAQITRRLAQETGRAVAWRNLALNGACSQRLNRELPDVLPESDLFLVSVGVNDVLQLRSPQAFQKNLMALSRRRPEAPWLLVGLPNLRDFPCLPYPLRDFLAWRMARLDAAAATMGQPWSSFRLLRRLTLDTFSPDQFHPGPLGCQAWAQLISPMILELLKVKRKRLSLTVI